MDFDSFVLCASTADLGAEPAAREHADAVEFRMDLASDPLEALDDYDGELPVLATNRAGWEGGDGGDDDERLDALATAATVAPVEAVDLELASVQDGDGRSVVEQARGAGVSVVVSTHDFEGTSDGETMATALDAGLEHGDVAKLAVTATDRRSVLSLLALTNEYDRAGDPVATIAMGEAGRHSRVVAPLYGSRIGYAPLDPADATAPGQFDLATTARLVDELSPQ
ncbi:type I 3-dehydroquinate dehydratase [Haloarchaeobius iranensis]|uniref:3-dehydroquinate dehydratase n=1 Tax=Haloarchaeobius iranensis TaxID=996166 RepID=A0A1G9X0T2_9EURY|nr:type I 3-dehydroquinate dehydratase [Haloarchaeobius iranensis]SDM90046.1 3-dehydroquinate dehydratase [Haloarchaeobius iranensis]